jgi:hypothetical protein
MTKLILVGCVAAALLAAPARADSVVKSPDGMMELSVPNGWHEMKPEGPRTKVLAVDGRGGRVAVRVFSKEDFKDLKAVAGYAVGQLNLIDTPEKTFQDIQVNKTPAVRLSFVGTEPNGMRRGFVITVFEVGGQYINVVASTIASSFAKDTPVLEAFANQLVTSTGPSATTAPAPGTAAPAAPKPQPPGRR